MPVFVRGDECVLFAHVPKTGGTALEQLFADSGYEVTYRDLTPARVGVRTVRRCSPQHMHALLLEETFHLGAIPVKFTVVREPIARFRSEFAHRHRPKDVEVTPQVVQQWGLRMLRRREEDPTWKDNHFRPQGEFVTDGMAVFRYEAGLGTVADALRAEHGLELPARLRTMNVPAAGTRSDDVPITQRLHAALVATYAGDYERFGFVAPPPDA